MSHIAKAIKLHLWFNFHPRFFSEGVGGGCTEPIYIDGDLLSKTFCGAQAAQAHDRNADVTLACERCCVTPKINICNPSTFRKMCFVTPLTKQCHMFFFVVPHL